MEQHSDRDIGIAEQFAKALDREDYRAAEQLLADCCVYDSHSSSRTAPAAIIQSYKSNGDWAAATFDSIRYESSVEPTANGGWFVTFVDSIRHKGRHFVYKCRQLVQVDGMGKICRIDQVDLPGQKEALQTFLKDAGVARKE